MTGADAATGKYLAFLDSDDFVSVDFYRAAVALAEENDFDLVMGDTVWQRENGDRFVRPVHADCVLEDELRGDAVRDAFFQQAMTCYSFHTIWNKVIRRDLWLRCAPYYAPLAKKHIVMTEDIAFSVVLYFFAQGFGRHRGDGVFYCEHSSSSTGAAEIRQNSAKITPILRRCLPLRMNFCISRGRIKRVSSCRRRGTGMRGCGRSRCGRRRISRKSAA